MASVYFPDYSRTVAGSGEFNGDGYEDMIIGAPYYDLGSADAGKVWMFAGEPVIFMENFETGDTLRLDRVVQ